MPAAARENAPDRAEDGRAEGAAVKRRNADLRTLTEGKQKPMKRTTAARLLALFAVSSAALFFVALPAPAERVGKGQGAIVIRDDAPVYESSKGPAVEWKLKRGDAVAGYTSNGILPPLFLIDEVNGRAHVMSYRGEAKGMNRTGWMDPKDLSRFTYDGSCGSNGTPLAVKGFSTRWNACFEEGRDTKLDQLRVLWEQQDAAAKASVPQVEPKPSRAPDASPTPAPAASPTPTKADGSAKGTVNR